MKPKLYAIAVYENTQTLFNLEKSDWAVLQLLHESHYSIVNKLGQTSGKIYDKEKYLNKKELLTQWKDRFVLRDLSAVMLLQKINQQQTGDHHLFVFEAKQHQSFNANYLTVEELRNRKIIRA